MQVLSRGREDSPGEGNGNPLQDSCLEAPMDRGAWRAMVHRVAKSQTRLKGLSLQAHGDALESVFKKSFPDDPVDVLGLEANLEKF